MFSGYGAKSEQMLNVFFRRKRKTSEIFIQVLEFCHAEKDVFVRIQIRGTFFSGLFLVNMTPISH